MILESAYLIVRKGETVNFEHDFKIASQYINTIDGYITHSLRRCLEQQNKYLLLVEWETLENHTVDFRESKAYLKWKEILHHYYEPFPTVEHFELVFEN